MYWTSGGWGIPQAPTMGNFLGILGVRKPGFGCINKVKININSIALDMYDCRGGVGWGQFLLT